MPMRNYGQAGPRLTKTRKLIVLVLLFALIFACILVIRSFPEKESEFVDSVAMDLRQEMEDNRIVLSSGGLRRTAADFKEPIILAHGQQSRLIVYSAQLSEKISLANEGLGAWEWTSIYQDIEYEGEAQYTVDLSKLKDEDFMVNNEFYTLTVRIPYAELASINIPAEQIRFHDAKKGWAAPKDIKLTPEQNAQLMIQVSDKMKAKLIDDNIIDLANAKAKTVVAELLTATVRSVAPEYSVIVVQ